MHGRPPSQGRRGMLEKIVQVNRLGRWSYTARGSACDFDRFTILYGDNGSGKTMLAAALDSLRSNEPKFVLGRRSLGQQGLPEISILSVAGLHRFEGGVWNEGHDHWRSSIPDSLIAMSTQG